MIAQRVKYFVSNSGRISFYWQGQAWHVEKTNPNYEKILGKVKAGEMNDVENLISPKAKIEQSMAVNIVNGELWFKGHRVKNPVVDRIIEFSEKGWKTTNLVNFLDKLLLNPSERSRENLYRFLEFNQMPITETGHFLAYKRVKDNYLDFYSGKFDNTPGNTLSIPRESVNPDENITCSTGLHVANLSYARDDYNAGSGRLVVCSVCPSKVVSVPVDYRNAKVRVCEYTVVEDMVSERRQEEYISLNGEEDWSDEDEEPQDESDDWDDDEDDRDYHYRYGYGGHALGD